MKLVSVILPSYNRSNMIIRAVNSILHQSYSYLELIVVDDGSSDETLTLLKQIKDQRLKVCSHGSNLGASVARNTGIDLAVGDYITFLDSDDEYMPRKIEKQILLFENSSVPNLGVVSCGREDLKVGQIYRRWIPKYRGNITERLCRKEIVGAGTPFLMVSRTILVEFNIRFDPDMPAGQDWDFLINVCQRSNFDFVPEPLVRVHHHNLERVFNHRNASIALERQFLKYRHLILNAKNGELLFRIKWSIYSYLAGDSNKAIIILSEYKSIFTALWICYFKIFPAKNSSNFAGFFYRVLLITTRLL